MVSEELAGTTEYLTLYTRCHINRCRYKRVRLPVCVCNIYNFTYVGMRDALSTEIFMHY